MIYFGFTKFLKVITDFPQIYSLFCTYSLCIPRYNMADEALAQAGLHFDELNKIRVLEPEVFQQTTELKEECKDFVESEFWSQI